MLVCDATDTPLQGALVQAAAPGLVHPGDANGSEVTDAHGRCELEVPAGPVDVLVQDGERAVRFEPSARTVTATVNAIAEVVVRPALREVRRVLVADEFRSVQLVTAGDTDFLDALLRDDQPVPEGILDAVMAFMQALPEEEWLHMGED